MVLSGVFICLVAWAFFIPVNIFALYAWAEEVTVEGEAVPEPESVHATGSVTTIDTQSAISRVSDVGEALEESAGATVRRYGGLGSYSVVMIRGTSPNQVAVFLDGVPLSGAATGAVNLADLPLDALDHIEMYRGVAPLGFGGAPIGGVINLVTRNAQKGWSAGASGSYGSFETYKSDVFGSAAYEKWNALLFYSHMQSEGNFEYLDDNGTPYNKEDDRMVRRQNNDFTSDDFLAKGGWKPAARWEIYAANEFFNKDSSLPGVGSFRVEEASLSTLRNTFYIGAHYLGAKTELRSLAYYTYIEEEYRDPKGEIGVGIQENRYYTNSWGANSLGRVFFGNRATVSLFAEGKNENYHERDLLQDSTRPKNSRLTFTGAAQGEFYFLDAAVIIVPTLRLEHYHSDFGESSSVANSLPAKEASASETLFSPHFGVRVTPWKPLSLTANVGQYYRLPSFVELFGDRGSVMGNSDLKVESGIHADSGAELSIKNRDWLNLLSASYAFFYLDVDDIIVMVQNSQRTAMAENISRARIYGHELGVEFVAAGFFKLHAVYTFEIARDRSGISYLNDNPLPGRPQNELSIRPALFRKRWGEIFYTFDYMDGNYLDRAGRLEVPARRIHGAGITVIPVEDLSVTFEAKNIGNDRVIDVLGYPLPGRSYFGTIKYVYSSKPKKANQ